MSIPFTPSRSTLHALPKIDLHRHLEGSIRLETLAEIAQTHALDFPTDPEKLRPYVQMVEEDFFSPIQFLSKFSALRQFYRSEAIIRRITAEIVEDAAQDNVRYLELRFTPPALVNVIGCPFDEAIAWVCDAAQTAADQQKITVSLIASMNRHESVASGEKIVDAALNHRDIIVGLDLAGHEMEDDAHHFADLFVNAKAQGLGITIHAGEWQSAVNIWNAIDKFQADRIGHGVRAAEDETLMQTLIARDIALEVCPTSNYQTGIIQTLADHPFKTFIQNAIPTTINTDDPAISQITLTDEIESALSHLPLTLDDIKRTFITAANVAFLPTEERQRLVTDFQTWLFPPPSAN